MKTETLIIGILGLTTLFTCVLTFYFYLQQKKSNYLTAKNREIAASLEDLTQGRYFKRYIPDSLQAKYEVKPYVGESAEKQTRKVFFKVFVTFFAAAATIFAFAVWSQYRRTLVIDLTAGELAAVPSKHFIWNQLYESPPVDSAVMNQLQKKYVILMVNPEHRDKLTDLALTEWSEWLRKKRIRFETCTWNIVSECLKNREQSLYVALPDRWNSAKLDEILESGASLFLFGPPTGLDSQKPFVWSKAGLTFETFPQRYVPSIALVGEKPLTLDWEAGQVLPLPPLDTSYRALSASFDGLAITFPFDLRGDFETRLFSLSRGDSRVAWTDFPLYAETPQGAADQTARQQASERLLSSIFRFLLKMPAQGVATWPEGKSMSAFLSLEVEDDYDRAETVRKSFLEAKAPLTMFILSDLAQRNESTLKRFASTQDLECFGDVHEKFAETSVKTQAERLARCRKVIYELTGKTPLGFRPPEEEYDRSTFDALANSDYLYLFGGANVDRAVPRTFISAEGGKRIVEFGRMVADDFNLTKQNRLSPSAATSVVKGQIDWTKGIGGMYGFSLHSQLSDSDVIQEVTRTLLSRLKEDSVYFSTISEIAAWWQVRSRIVDGLPVRTEEKEKFKPYLLQLLPTGEVKKVEYTDGPR